MNHHISTGFLSYVKLHPKEFNSMWREEFVRQNALLCRGSTNHLDLNGLRARAWRYVSIKGRPLPPSVKCVNLTALEIKFSFSSY